ncbi:hypothetical protein EJ08DRAFT_395027 [Tothia fuscella]|uniref:Uncharacterized protein n=1 Tax=Tothia fuscella TaxID=1048955 RepID=A0A9P4U356_9PEZI|nr:hypothetical protein EJ08DRAFT_395027 [Tothia fuscella]
MAAISLQGTNVPTAFSHMNDSVWGEYFGRIRSMTQKEVDFMGAMSSLAQHFDGLAHKTMLLNSPWLQDLLTLGDFHRTECAYTNDGVACLKNLESFADLHRIELFNHDLITDPEIGILYTILCLELQTCNKFFEQAMAETMNFPFQRQRQAHRELLSTILDDYEYDAAHLEEQTRTCVHQAKRFTTDTNTAEFGSNHWKLHINLVRLGFEKAFHPKNPCRDHNAVKKMIDRIVGWRSGGSHKGRSGMVDCRIGDFVSAITPRKAEPNVNANLLILRELNENRMRFTAVMQMTIKDQGQKLREQQRVITALAFRSLLENLPEERHRKKKTTCKNSDSESWIRFWDEAWNQADSLTKNLSNQSGRLLCMFQHNGKLKDVINSSGKNLYKELSEVIHRYTGNHEVDETQWNTTTGAVLHALKPERDSTGKIDLDKLRKTLIENRKP